MRQQAGRIALALVLILFGVVALLDSMNVLDLPWVITGPNMIWLLLFGIAGVSFIIAFFSHKDNWWAIIPGLTLLGLAILVGNFLPGNMEVYGAGIFMGLLASSFWIVYLSRRENWWAIIPGGVLLSITALILIEEAFQNDLLSVAIMFLGMGVTFLMIYILPSPARHAQWPLYPAGILGVMGVLFLIGAGQAVNWLGAVILIALGGWVIFRSLRKPRV